MPVRTALVDDTSDESETTRKITMVTICKVLHTRFGDAE